MPINKLPTNIAAIFSITKHHPIYSLSTHLIHMFKNVNIEELNRTSRMKIDRAIGNMEVRSKIGKSTTFAIKFYKLVI